MSGVFTHLFNFIEQNVKVYCPWVHIISGIQPKNPFQKKQTKKQTKKKNPRHQGNGTRRAKNANSVAGFTTHYYGTLYTITVITFTQSEFSIAYYTGRHACQQSDLLSWTHWHLWFA